MGPNALLLDYIRTIISVTMLVFASYKDIKTREVHDKIWILPGAAGLSIDAYELYVGNISIQVALFNIFFMIILSTILWFFRLFGEADLIAFILLAVIHPRTPLYYFRGFTPIFFSFTMIANTAILGVLVAFYTFAFNIFAILSGRDLFERHRDVSGFKKLVIMFTGRNKQIESLKGPPFEYPLEVKGELIIKPDIFDDDEANNVFRVYREKGVKRTWVSSTLPYIVVLTVGYIISVFYGDVMFTIMSKFL
jgi:preflagellin peptidase FlaK